MLRIVWLDKTNYQDTCSSFLLYFFSRHALHYLCSFGEMTRIVRILSTPCFFYVNNSGPDLQIKWIRLFHLQCVCVNNVKLILFIGMPKVKAKAGSMMNDSFTEGADAFWGFSPEEQEQLKETPPFHNPDDLISCELLHFGTKISAQLKPVLILTAFLIVFTRFHFQSGFSSPLFWSKPQICLSGAVVPGQWDNYEKVIFLLSFHTITLNEELIFVS